MRNLLLILSILPLTAQTQPLEAVKVKSVIDGFIGLIGTSKVDSMDRYVMPDLQLVTVLPDASKAPVTSSVVQFRDGLKKMQGSGYSERLNSYDIQIDGRLASAWCEYTLWAGKEIEHCGTDHFVLVKVGRTWKISHITDTRRYEGCHRSDSTMVYAHKAVINSLMDNWHRAAATGDSSLFFGSMTPDAVYLGTQDDERWERDTFARWASPYFQRGKAWDFSPRSRVIYFSDDLQTAWMEELLDTWMGVTRGTAVLSRQENGQWKIRHYNLAITVPNSKIKKIIKLLNDEDELEDPDDD